MDDGGDGAVLMMALDADESPHSEATGSTLAPRMRPRAQASN